MLPHGFSPALRVPVTWAGLGLLVLPQLTQAAEEHYGALQEARSSARKRPQGAPAPAGVAH